MTIFVASLFLPHTINFHLPRPKNERRSTLRRSGSGPPGRQLSLLQRKPPKVPLAVQTPGATLDNERIFILPELSSFTLSLPNGKSDLVLSNGAPAAPLENYSADWGSSVDQTQPRSRAKPPPPASILKHDKIRERTASIMWRAQAQYKAQERARRSHERNFSMSGFTVARQPLGNVGLHNAIHAACESGLLQEKTWVGTLGMPTDALESHVKSDIAERLEDDHDCLTVFVDDDDFDGAYAQYCKTMLWPHFHYQIPDHPRSKAYEDHSYHFYVNLNQAFADRIIKNYKRGDIIWIHDYHLLLLPGMLRKLLPEAQIGFHLHVAFPSSEIFRCLAMRKELLEGMLGANLIGFQTEEYGHHFLQTCSRLLTVEATTTGISLEDRFVNVETFPMGIDPSLLDKRRKHNDVAQWINIIQQKYHGKRLIVARDKLDSIRGVRQKILAYERFLDDYPEYRDDVVLIQIATSSTEQMELDAAVSDIINRVNSVYSTLAHQPIVYLKQDLPYSQYLALLTVADCFFITSLREGMNLTCHEFVYCQDGNTNDLSNTRHGPLILSEFTGSAAVFSHHDLLVNPWDSKQCSEMLKKALDMSPQARKASWHSLYTHVVHNTATLFIQSFLEHLQTAWEEQGTRDTMSVPRLQFKELAQKYQNANKRLFFIDYEGTLASWGSPTSIILTTPKKAIDVLNDLLLDEKNMVYVTSSRMPEEMERLFRRVPNLGMIAESGCYLMEAGTDDWIELVDTAHAREWKESVKQILAYYSERIHGSTVEERHCSVVFDYSNAEDAQAAQKQAGECAIHINESCQNHNIHAIPVDGTLVISHDTVNKATAAAEVLKGIMAQGEAVPNFLFAVGDTREDEPVFKWANTLHGKTVQEVVSVTLAQKNTDATHTLTQGVTGVISTLQKLAELH